MNRRPCLFPSTNSRIVNWPTIPRTPSCQLWLYASIDICGATPVGIKWNSANRRWAKVVCSKMVTRNHPELGFRGFQFGLTPKRYKKMFKPAQFHVLMTSLCDINGQSWAIQPQAPRGQLGSHDLPESLPPAHQVKPRPSRPLRSEEGFDAFAEQKQHSFTSEKLRKTRKRAYYKSGSWFSKQPFWGYPPQFQTWNMGVY
jgi:hypothetical protein